MKGKKVLSVLLASVMMFTAVPVGSIGAMAAPVQNAQVQEQCNLTEYLTKRTF